MPRRQPPASSADVREDKTPASLRGARPWGNFAKSYFDAGWCPLPLPPRKKSSPPTGTTGKYEMPDKKKVAAWHKSRDPRCNIALRVPDDIIGIDVDAYDAKIGRASLVELEKEFGPLPPTWTLTSRRDGISGIRFFRVPAGLHWPGEPAPDVQIVQNHHRYAVAYPSVHPDTRELYLWYAPGDALTGVPSVTVDNEIPNVATVTDLPSGWVEGLSSGRLWKGLAADADATSADIAAWAKARPGGEMCRLMRKQAAAAAEEMTVGGAHDTLNSRLYSIVSLAVEGHSGVLRALRKVKDAFFTEVSRPGRKGRRSEAEARREFARARDGAIRIMMASVADGEAALEEDCACSGSSLDWGEKLGLLVEPAEDGKTAKFGKAKPADKYTFDDSGNAEHMLDILDGSAYWVHGVKSWYFWDPRFGAWQPDVSGARAMQAAQLIGRRCRELSDSYMDKLKAQGSSLALDVGGDMSQRIAQLDKHAKISSDRKGLESMVKVASVQSRADATIEEFDALPMLFACPNGTIELNADGYVFREARREDKLSITSGVVFDPAAECGAWDAYLSRFLPGEHLRRYVQKIAGYSLFGGNPERKMFFLQGGTSTGKSTFGKVLSAAFGQHAGTMNLSLFRDNQDEKPRADLVGALSRRLLVAYETSNEWHLHGDQIKRLTGGDPLKARLLYSSVYVDRRPAFTPFVVTNTMPQVSGADKALQRRLVRVPFVVSVAEGEEDFRIEPELLSPAGRAAVLAWAVRGWEIYREEGSLAAPEEVVLATQQMLDELTDLDVFLREFTVPSETGRIPSGTLFERWQEWVDVNNVDAKKMSANKFGRELTGRGFETKTARVKGDLTKVKVGLRWRSEVE